MSEAHRELWIRILEVLRPKVRKSHFLTWFPKSALLSHEDDTVVIGFHTVMVQDWVMANCYEILCEAVQAVLPEVKEVVCEVDVKLGDKEDPRLVDVQGLGNPDKKKVRKVRNRQEYTVNAQGVRSKALNPRYTLDSFIIGTNNRLAHAASVAVSQKPGGAYNPLFVYGEVGLGKTHLLQATGNAVLRHNPDYVVAYMTAERFTNEIVEAIRKRGVKAFKTKYRSVDCLILDDIQFLGGKERTQEEFFHTFNELYDANKQIIISADRPPKELKGIEDRLISRFEWGMIVDVQFPDYETRLAIAHAKCREHQVLIDAEVLEFIAFNIHSSIRELEGVLKQAIGQYELENITPTVRSVATIMKKLNRSGEFAVLTDGREQRSLAKTPEDVIEIVADYFKLTKSDLIGPGRKKEILVPRQISMYLIRKELDASFEQIGEEFDRNHTTVMHAVEKIIKLMRKDRKLIRDINAIKGEMGL